MRCYHPVQGYRTANGVVFAELGRDDHLGSIEIACGRCIGCRERRASDWALRVMHEASLYEDSCFLTLTYAPGHVPEHGSLDHRDIQLFLKRVRKKFGPVRFYMCGEYGPENGRPHYHMALFGVGFRLDRKVFGRSKSGMDYFESAELSALWPLGRATVQDLVAESASYVARYIMKKRLGEDAKDWYDWIDADGVVHPRRPEYGCMSLKPGVGYYWFKLYGRSVFPQDFVVADGGRRQVPKYYDRLLKRSGSVVLDYIQYGRELRARDNLVDETDERRAVREAVHKARISTLTRGDCDDAS